MNQHDRMVELPTATIYFRADGYIHLHYKSHSFTLNDNKRIFDTTREHSPWEFCPFLITSADFSDHDKASKLFNTSRNVVKHCSAYAFIVENTAQKLVIAHFVKSLEINIPCRAFSNKTEATNWLLTYTWLNEPKS